MNCAETRDTGQIGITNLLVGSSPAGHEETNFGTCQLVITGRSLTCAL